VNKCGQIDSLSSWRIRLARSIGHFRRAPKGQDRLVRLLCNPDTAAPVPFEVDFFGLRYQGSLNDFIDWSVYFYGAYARNELSVLGQFATLLRHDNRHVVYLDVGVNVGQHLLFMTRRADDCIGIEPLDEVMAKAEEKLRLNQITNARLFRTAFGDIEDIRPFFPSISSNHAVGSFLPDWALGATSQTGISTQIVRGERFLASSGIDHVSIVKIDVEGFEAPVCRGLTSVFERDRPLILLEISPEGQKDFISETHLRSVLYPEAKIYRLGRNKLVPYAGFDGRLAELAIVPAEYNQRINHFRYEISGKT
jgi:FkbM family methyltransferase